ncbi:MAG: [FeFe]-hydrogenase, partial [Streblomastix strix]
AVLKLGFKEMVEVALGADNTSLNESAEFLAEVATGKQPLMTTSCCPAWVRAIKVHVPGLVPYISTAGSPMKYTGDLVKKRSPDSITVFIGPCTAKRTEGAGLDNIDHVLTVEELLCAFNAQEIEPSKMPKEDNPTTRLPSAESTAYCGAQNVTAAVVSAVPKATYLNQQRGEGGTAVNDLQPVYISPLDKKSFKQVKIWGDKIDQIPGNLIECMNCEGGCISGPGNIVSGTVAQARFKQLMKERPQFNDIEDVTSLN